MENLKEGVLFGMGNPLLDITAAVELSFLEKYELKPDNAILAEDKHIPMYKEITEKYKVDYTAGGATQNSLRVAQWILKKPNTATFMGAVGKDDFAEILKKSATNDGVNVQYQIIEDQATGTCAVLITGSHRSLCAYLAAANHFTKDHIEKPENMAYIQRAEYFYISGFFLTVSPESALQVAKFANSSNRPFMMNLSAPFIPQFFTDKLNLLLPYIDILFGNETEAVEFSKVKGFGTEDIAEIALKTYNLPRCEESKCERLIVFTQGGGDIIVAKDGKILKFPVKQIPTEKIVDTNGAGDAFAGGFIAQYVMKKPLETCIKCGIWTATEIIQNQGCTFDKEKTFTM